MLLRHSLQSKARIRIASPASTTFHLSSRNTSTKSPPDTTLTILTDSRSPNKDQEAQPPTTQIIDVESLESTQNSTEYLDQHPHEAPPTWTADAEQLVLKAQLGSAEKAIAAYTSVEKNVRSGGAGGSALSREAAERKFLRENRQESRPGSDMNPVTNNTPVTTRQFLENKTGSSSKLSRAVRVMHAKEDAQAYKTPTQQLWDDYWVVRPTIENFESIVEERISQARRSGQFDDLPGKGKPLELLTSDLRHNPFLSDTEVIMNRMLQTQGHVPGWVELGKEIDEEIIKLRKELGDIWKECFPPAGTGEKNSNAGVPVASNSGLTGKMLSWIVGPQLSASQPASLRKTGIGLWREKGNNWAKMRVDEINAKTGIYRRDKLFIQRLYFQK
ncbi:hypothetical protein HDU67_001000 [Dinochytrium kinnereticum]|nr:hypothetical protein HDU67_001000 [Dinochytrium kinnereticum]